MARTLEAIGARLQRVIHGSPATSVQRQLENAALGVNSTESPIVSAESDLLDLQETARARTGFSFGTVMCLDKKFPEGAALPLGWTKPEAWLYDQIRKGKLPETTMDLPNTLFLIEDVQKPEVSSLGTSYYGNPGMGYAQHIAACAARGIFPSTSRAKEARALELTKDPLAKYLAIWRERGQIETMSGVRQDSRFGLSAEEIDHLVLPQVVRMLNVMLNVKPEQVKLPKAAVSMYAGNELYPEWGQTSSSEWYDDRFGESSRLVGGGRHGIFSSNPDSLGNIDCAMSNSRSATRGFRIVVLQATPEQS